MPEASERQGGCHCGAVRYTVTTDLAQVIECNCSHCAKKGFLLTFVPQDRFTLASGEDSLTEYRFNTHKIAHLFCKVCGVQAQQTRLMGLSCKNGSKAFANANQVRISRRGNVGPGGRCGSIVDLYIAKCPEAEYEVHVDMYMCGPGETF